VLQCSTKLSVGLGDPPDIESGTSGIDNYDRTPNHSHVRMALQVLQLALESIRECDVIRIHPRDVIRGA
jgi:hypothetical protein